MSEGTLVAIGSRRSWADLRYAIGKRKKRVEPQSAANIPSIDRTIVQLILLRLPQSSARARFGAVAKLNAEQIARG